MRTLLVDNYDSFTYNLFQLIGTVNGAEPTVLRNDEVDTLAELDLARFDNIVVSPGPGRPDVAKDFGISQTLIEDAQLPLLGVCLGHQGIVLAAGGRVIPAPAPRHGYPDRISHDGRDLFAGVPADFLAVRYHSLCAAQPLPDALAITATAPDGVVMGVRHRRRPQWGVQFHPESVSSEFGAALLGNFARLTREWWGRRTMTGRAPRVDPSRDISRPGERPARRPLGRTADTSSTGTTSTAAGPVPSGPAPGASAVSARRSTPEGTDIPSASGRPAGAADESATRPPTLTVLHEVIDRAVDTESVVLRVYPDSPTVFWLDSAHVERGLDRFSFAGDASGPLAEVVRYRVGAGCVIENRTGTRTDTRPVLDYLSARLSELNIRFPDVPFDFAGGYVGYLGYEMKADCGAKTGHRSPYPDAQWLFADRLVVVDHVAGRTHLIAVTDADSADENHRWLADTRAVVAALPDRRHPEPLTLPADEEAVISRLSRGRDRYLADIAAIDAELRAGETYEVNLTDSATIDSDAPGLDVYRMLRRSNPAPYAAYLRFGELHIACSSPERFLKIDRTRTVETKPIKGTAPRGATPEADENLCRALELDPKTRAENLMIVDLLRNDLGRVCELGSVHVPELMVAETYTTMHQLVSTVRGRLRPEVDVLDCLRACFPGGSMTGAPKLRTMEIIDGLETEARGIYSGTIGFLGLGGTADLNIVIRTAVRDERGWRVGAGGAVVLDSDADAEFHEMVLKAAAAARAVIATAELPRSAGRADLFPAST
ncbi:aminodeoxychorismate synthase, component I [Nocardia nova]|uniref:aminodeoxychorismate synthase n=1 Tax=Nocardia nova TaxID=37330 RepID=A0A2S6AIM8_9NOCA|nr:aminodeoxychorismate synthase component I [Nocardia nova]PPJ23767.1 aminodeoxychorismate synthase, component I [Nocardia nova]PPJ35086.1 aminodeoxychorismate synthase, component I [Nocardia nova]